MSTGYILKGILVMAFVTYLIRMLPLVIFRKKITNRRLRSFLYYIPYAVLAAMTFPAIFTSTGRLSAERWAAEQLLFWRISEKVC